MVGMLALAVIPASAGVHVSFSGGSVHGGFTVGGGSYGGHGYGGGYHGGFYASSGGGRCSYTPNCYGNGYRCGYNYPCYNNYAWYGYYGGYIPAIYTGYSYSSYVEPIPVPVPESVPPPQAVAPAPAPAPTTPAPAPAPLEFGILDVNGFVHSPYSDAIFKVPGVRNAQMVYDPVTGKPFLVR